MTAALQSRTPSPRAKGGPSRLIMVRLTSAWPNAIVALMCSPWHLRTPPQQSVRMSNGVSEWPTAPMMPPLPNSVSRDRIRMAIDEVVTQQSPNQLFSR
jgi:hypothetical protein